ncbi:MAG: hypothetical protein JSR59_10200 [Proteobacteria bacterium]|nr:hypothetical protein [Pseudomonadota bacterium]
MSTLVHSAYLDSSLGELTELPSAGTSLENPYVYDSAARELKQMADRGLVRIVDEQAAERSGDQMISRIRFVRVR